MHLKLPTKAGINRVSPWRVAHEVTEKVAKVALDLSARDWLEMS